VAVVAAVAVVVVALVVVAVALASCQANSGHLFSIYYLLSIIHYPLSIGISSLSYPFFFFSFLSSSSLHPLFLFCSTTIGLEISTPQSHGSSMSG
jgi:hypothetical protein